MISNDDLKKYIDDRNLIAHNYFRFTRIKINGNQNISDPESFLKKFIADGEYWWSVVRGLLYTLLQAANEKNGEHSKNIFNDQQMSDMAFYREHAGKILSERQDCTSDIPSH